MIEATIPSFSQKLTPFQLEMLRLGSMDLNDEELIEVKDAIAKVALKCLSRSASESAKINGYTAEDYLSWLNDEDQ